ncbi:hypothetical protein T07_11283 [Trichinella nelsoni]|uniref:Uncharacterized protein n=1 Tax=Trichinella nelsoni TaxID=6336 RepID=A0A0V0RT04_9BILA|nr:hypothetical protein T07_11283 [Trichinella nelsoni]
MKEVNVQNVEELNEGEFRCLETSERVIGQLAVLGAIFDRENDQFDSPRASGMPTWQQFFRASIFVHSFTSRFGTHFNRLPKIAPPLTLAPTGDLQQASSLILRLIPSTDF